NASDSPDKCQIPFSNVCALLIVLSFSIFSLFSNVHAAQVSHLFDITSGNDKALKLPSDVVVNSRGEIIIVDGGNHRVLVFTSKGKFSKEIGATDPLDVRLQQPLGIGIDANDQIYVVNKGKKRINIYHRKGKLLHSFETRNHQGLFVPVDVAVSADVKTILVTNNTHHQIALFSNKGVYQASWGKEGSNAEEFRYPATLVTDKQSNAYVVDVLNTQVKILNPNGSLQTTVAEWGVLPGQLFRPKGVALDDEGNIFVSDSYLNLVQIYAHNKKFQSVLSNPSGYQHFDSPTGLTIDQKRRLIVTEMRANKVSVFLLL
ncbi:MAG: NHL repeat-containing protein, partial [Gammaproteobacteria bacterium]|nr:NHL repeat-containing protein [Gammaproteobacteria bacterium]